MKSMTNTANVENADSINNPPGCLWCIYSDFMVVELVKHHENWWMFDEIF
jgi:hypothetical protein